MSIARLLQASFAEDEPVPGSPTRVAVVRAEDLRKDPGATPLVPPLLTLYLYRIGYSSEMRASSSATGYRRDQAILPLDLHYLLTGWAASAEQEHRILGKALITLELYPVLTGPLLDTSIDWPPGESVHVALDDAPPVDALRGLPLEGRLSVPYVASVRLDSLPRPRPWVARRDVPEDAQP